jgi:hypothetical protein
MEKGLFMPKAAKTYQPPSHEEIAACARRIYETEGRPEGKATEHWLQAEAQLIAERKAQAGILPAKTPPKPLNAASPAAVTARGEGWQTPAARTALHRN